MGRVLRRTVLKGLIGTAALGGCTTTAPTPSTPSVAPSSSAPPKAPSRVFPIKSERLSLARGADRPLPTTIWRPTTAGTYPLILFSHGLEATPANYRELLTTWAKAGFIVAAPTYPHTAAGVADFNPVDLVYQPLDAEYVITQVAKRLGPVGPIAAAGHSGGGVTTLGMLSGNRDDRLKAAVVMAGRQIIATPLTGPSTPLLFVHGKRDEVIDYADDHAVYAATTWPKAFLTVTDGGHVPTGAELAVVATTSTDFLRWSLYGDPAAKRRLPRDATRGNLATLENRL